MPKTPKSSAKKVPPPGSATAEEKPKPPTELDQLKFLLKRFKKMDINDDGKCGFNFTDTFPYIWYTYKYGEHEFIRYDFLVWSPHLLDYDALLTKDGKKLYFTHRIPKVFTNPKRVSTQHHAIDSFNEANRVNNPCFLAAKTQHAAVDSFFELEDIKPTIEIKLPMQVDCNFDCPYDPDGAKSLHQYPHEHSRVLKPVLDADEQAALQACPDCQGVRRAVEVINIYTCSMKSVTVARKKEAATKVAHVGMF